MAIAKDYQELTTEVSGDSWGMEGERIEATVKTVFVVLEHPYILYLNLLAKSPFLVKGFYFIRLKILMLPLGDVAWQKSPLACM